MGEFEEIYSLLSDLLRELGPGAEILMHKAGLRMTRMDVLKLPMPERIIEMTNIKKMYEKALEIALKVHGNDSLQAYHAYSMLSVTTADSKQAKKYLKKAKRNNRGRDVATA